MRVVYEVNVNNIMTVEKNIPLPWKGNSTCLKSYVPRADLSVFPSVETNNTKAIVAGSEEIRSSINLFSILNADYIGSGRTFLLPNGDGSLTEFYSGLRVVPVDSEPVLTQTDRLDEAQYFDGREVTDDKALYVPKSLLSEYTSGYLMDVISSLFYSRHNDDDIENRIVRPLTSRQNLVNTLYSQKQTEQAAHK